MGVLVGLGCCKCLGCARVLWVSCLGKGCGCLGWVRVLWVSWLD